MRKLPALALALALPLASLVLGVMGCERDEIVSVDPGSAPGQSSRSVESILAPAEVAGWTDSVFGGFAGAAGAAFLLVEGGTPELTSRALLRFSLIGDSVAVGDTVSALESFQEGRVTLALDTLRSALAGSGTTLQLRTVEQAWDLGSASWELAIDTPGVMEPWTGGPGGSLGPVLSEVTFTEFPDSIVLPLGESSDSLIRRWSDTAQTNTGLALVVADSGRLVLAQAAGLHYRGVPELEPDTSFEFRAPSTASTFIFDRAPLPELSGVLRVGGLEGWRTFVEIVLSDSLRLLDASGQGRLRGATVNRAELILTSLPRPPEPFDAEVAFQVAAFELADDFRIFGPKTPVGDLIAGSSFILRPDTLDVGEVVRIDVTESVQEFASLSPDSTALPLRLVVRATTEGTTLGFWQFGAAESDPEVQPLLRIVFTPPVEFRLP